MTMGAELTVKTNWNVYDSVWLVEICIKSYKILMLRYCKRYFHSYFLFNLLLLIALSSDTGNHFCDLFSSGIPGWDHHHLLCRCWMAPVSRLKPSLMLRGFPSPHWRISDAERVPVSRLKPSVMLRWFPSPDWSSGALLRPLVHIRLTLLAFFNLATCFLQVCPSTVTKIPLYSIVADRALLHSLSDRLGVSLGFPLTMTNVIILTSLPQMI